jgi:2OG-Fe(II) oxygenase superfamily
MITIHKSGIHVDLKEDEIDGLHQQFHRKHFIRLRELLSEDLLERFYSEIEEANWRERVHNDIGVEVCLSDPGIASLMNFLWNDQDLFRLLERITGCEPIGSFEGRVYRMIPNSGHYDSWHTDYGEHRLLAMSVNLTKGTYEGGLLQIRRHGSAEPAVDAPNTEFGSAVIFRIAEGFEHRVTNVEGNVARTAFAGWFKSQPDIWETLSRYTEITPAP